MNWLVLGLGTYSVLSLGSMATMSIGVAVVVLALLVGLGGPRSLGQAFLDDWRREPLYRAYFWLALGLAGACALSLVVAAIWPLGYGGKFVKVHFAKDMLKAWYLFWPLALYTGLSRAGETGRAKILRAWLVMFGVLSVIGIVQYFTGWPRPQTIPNLAGRFHATLFMGHHLSVASVLIFPFFAALDLAFRKDSVELAGLRRSWLLVFVALGMVTLFLTYSRMLWIALPVGFALWAALALPRRWVAGLLASMLVVGLGATQVPAVRERAMSVMGTNERLDLWRANWEFFKERPLTGSGWHHNMPLSGYYLAEQKGPGWTIFSGHAHNNAIEQLGGMGLFGLVAWIAWWIGVIAWTVRARAVPGFARGILCAWLVFHLNGLTQVNFWESKVLHQQAWMIAFILVWLSTSKPKAKARKA